MTIGHREIARIAPVVSRDIEGLAIGFKAESRLVLERGISYLVSLLIDFCNNRIISA